LEAETLDVANQRLMSLFDDHVCDEDVSQAAARIVKEPIDQV
jgi:hypothetical protein